MMIFNHYGASTIRFVTSGVGGDTAAGGWIMRGGVAGRLVSAILALFSLYSLNDELYSKREFLKLER